MGNKEKGKAASSLKDRALNDFIDTINVTGGIVLQSGGLYAPAADEEWIDLGEAYILACEATGKKPKKDDK